MEAQSEAKWTAGQWQHCGPNGKTPICKMLGGDAEVNEANARLISQAPALIQALEEITNEAADNLENIGLPHDKAMMMLALVDQARAVIARAKGEQ